MVRCRAEGRRRGANGWQAARGTAGAVRTAGGRRGEPAAQSHEKGQLPHRELTASACMFMHIVGLALPYMSFSITSPPHHEKSKRWRALIGFKRVVGHSCRAFCILLSVARTARSSPSGGMADTEVSKTSGGNLVRVRPSPRAPRIRPAPRIARPAFFVVSMPKRAQRRQALGHARRKPALGRNWRKPASAARR